MAEPCAQHKVFIVPGTSTHLSRSPTLCREWEGHIRIELLGLHGASERRPVAQGKTLGAMGPPLLSKQVSCFDSFFF